MRALWLLLLLPAGCLNVNRSFPCSSDAECRSSTGDGVCVLQSSRCAFSDSECGSGFRYGELADDLSGTCVDSTAPPIDGGPDVSFRSVSSGDAHTCAVTTDDKLYCWGSNASGQLGFEADTSEALTPTLVELDDVQVVATGRAHTCAIAGTTEGNRIVYCWGDNSQGQLGSGVPATLSTPSPVLTETDAPLSSATLLSVGEDHGCAVDDDTLYCWGNNEFGRCGVPVMGDARIEQAVQVTGQNASAQIVALDLGSRHSCALERVATNYAVRCFGDNRDLQAGVAPTGTLDTMTASNFSFSASTSRNVLSAGGEVTCAINDATENLQCWGSNEASQLGSIIGAENTELPTPVALTDTPRQVSVGFEHVCAAVLNGVVSCWGNNTSGQVGNGQSGTTVEMPTTLSLVVDSGDSLSAGKNHSCAIVNGGVLRCWGDNASGQLGTGDRQLRNTPTDVTLGN